MDCKTRSGTTSRNRRHTQTVENTKSKKHKQHPKETGTEGRCTQPRHSLQPPLIHGRIPVEKQQHIIWKDGQENITINNL